MLLCLFIVLLNRICILLLSDKNTNTKIKIINVNVKAERICRSFFNKK
jgi:hypothetical protein